MPSKSGSGAKGPHKSPGPMHSKAQLLWKFLYATKKPFAHKWAEEIVATRGPKTGYRSLPVRKGVHR